MAGDQAVSRRYAIGFGARPGVDAQALVALVREAAQNLGVELQDARLATIDARANEAGVQAAATMLDLELMFFPVEVLRRRGSEALTRSARVEELFGVGSIAETAALAGAGEGSVLLAPRMAAGALTCAIARSVSEGEEK
jgi:cobalt-precorrin 5A hydrolase